MVQRLTIIGLGLLGGSIGLAVRKRLSGCRITGCAHRDKSLIEAQKRGAVDDWTLDLGVAVGDADLVVLCMPVSQIPGWTERLSPHLKRGAIITDVGSTKQAIVDAGERWVRPPAHFVGSHPMAGSEKTGVAVARADLFQGATCIVTRTAQTDASSADVVERFWQALGCRVVRHSPSDHDRLVALISHLPHAAAAALVAVQDAASLDLHGKGFLDSTRIAAGDPELWRDIFTDNRDNVLGAIDRLIEELSRVRTQVANDPKALEAWLREAASVRAGVEERKTRRA